jgi:hypothetical protein
MRKIITAAALATGLLALPARTGVHAAREPGSGAGQRHGARAALQVAVISASPALARSGAWRSAGPAAAADPARP